MSDQTRPPPAYQEYAADWLANRDYRLMGLAARGLVHTMRLECWVNLSVPADPDRLARLLGSDVGEVRALLPDAMRFFEEHAGELISPDLERYRAAKLDYHERQKAHGKRGAKKRWTAANASNNKASSAIGTLSQPYGDPNRVKVGSEKRREEKRRGEASQEKRFTKGESLSPETENSKEENIATAAHEEWVSEYNEYPEFP